jgi:hypothetical protein
MYSAIISKKQRSIDFELSHHYTTGASGYGPLLFCTLPYRASPYGSGAFPVPTDGECGANV